MHSISTITTCRHCRFPDLTVLHPRGWERSILFSPEVNDTRAKTGWKWWKSIFLQSLRKSIKCLHSSQFWDFSPNALQLLCISLWMFCLQAALDPLHFGYCFICVSPICFRPQYLLYEIMEPNNYAEGAIHTAFSIVESWTMRLKMFRVLNYRILPYSSFLVSLRKYTVTSGVFALFLCKESGSHVLEDPRESSPRWDTLPHLIVS